jgi:hypothetical protein
MLSGCGDAARGAAGDINRYTCFTEYGRDGATGPAAGAGDDGDFVLK